MTAVKFKMWDEGKKSWREITVGAHAYQFTGRFSVDAQEIFEGDIIRRVGPNTYKKHENYIVVRRDEFRTGFFPFSHDCIAKDYERIGNIYQNPELARL